MKAKKSINYTYASLFSGGGVGCYGFKSAGFECVFTQELLEKRLVFQKYNEKCKYSSGYISGDITSAEVKSRIKNEIALWRKKENLKELDVLIATPPCQGMSVANHKKKDELSRNSLVVESIRLTLEMNPKFFIFENVRAFLTTICTDIDNKDKPIKEAIELNLGGHYHILYRVVNFKDFGNPSSRTRTLVIGVRKDLKEITPNSIFPSESNTQTLFEVIGHLPPISIMGDINENDILHGFKSYDPRMLSWIENIGQGESAFDNINPQLRPHSIVDGEICTNTNKNGDKYRRQIWSKPAPCIHTRNDIMASQNTVHPVDNRVFSIREIMLMMSIPPEFKWFNESYEQLNLLPLNRKKTIMEKAEMTIRHTIGEAVPTIIFTQIANKIRHHFESSQKSDQEIKSIIVNENLSTPANLLNFIKENSSASLPFLFKISEMANAAKNDNAAYYTRQDICFSIINDLPDFRGKNSIRILEPSVGSGNFLPLLFQKYQHIPTVIIDVVDIDPHSINILRSLVKLMDVPSNFRINYFEDDFLKIDLEENYDLVIGNPPYFKITKNKKLLDEYKLNAQNQDTNNIFSFFIEKALSIGKIVSLIVPKSLVNSPEFDITRKILSNYKFLKLNDFGELGFKDVLIETISFSVETKNCPVNNVFKFESFISKSIKYVQQSYVMDYNYPYWLLYRDEYFDEISLKLDFNVFKSFRDRQITKKHTLNRGRIQVLKSRNISSNKIISIPKYDCFVDDASKFSVSKYLNASRAVCVPNLTYYPRACFLPKNSITDGSVAILSLKNGHRKPTKKDLEYFGTKEFEKFYQIARNFGTRSLNIDNNSVFFFGLLKNSNNESTNKCTSKPKKSRCPS